MVDITQPTILGCAITPWFITLCSCIIGTVVFTIVVISGFSKRGSKERKMIENAVKNTSSIPVRNIAMPITDFGTDGQNETELIIDDKTEGLDIKSEGFEDNTEVIEFKTEGMDLKTEGLNE